MVLSILQNLNIYMIDLTVVHDPTVIGVTYEQFLQEVDLNEDGKVLALRNPSNGLRNVHQLQLQPIHDNPFHV